MLNSLNLDWEEIRKEVKSKSDKIFKAGSEVSNVYRNN
jgi:hypothetical protein